MELGGFNIDLCTLDVCLPLELSSSLLLVFLAASSTFAISRALATWSWYISLSVSKSCSSFSPLGLPTSLCFRLGGMSLKQKHHNIISSPFNLMAYTHTRLY